MHLRREIDPAGVCRLIFDQAGASVNVMSLAAVEELDRQLAWIEGSPDLRGVILESAKPGNFIAGADLALLGAGDAVAIEHLIARGQQTLTRLSRLAIPSVALIRGICVAGGLEIALACDWRVAVDEPSTQLGLPETQLGLLPAWGGSVRLPRVIGMRAALDLILSGRRVTAAEAAQLGLIDALASPEAAPARAISLLGSRRTAWTAPEPSGVLADLAVETRGSAGSPAQSKALAVAIAARSLDLPSALALERAALVELATTDETRGLIAQFFARQKSRKSRAPLSQP